MNLYLVKKANINDRPNTQVEKYTGLKIIPYLCQTDKL